MSTKSVYICGSMAGRLGADVQWERALVSTLLKRAGFIPHDPARNENIVADKHISSALPIDNMADYVVRDLSLLSKSDALILLTGDFPTDGSWWEMAYATLSYKIPVVVVSPLRVKSEIVGFTNVLIDHIYKTPEEAIDALKSLLK